jgi:predicted phage terminase large subunit-like protein
LLDKYLIRLTHRPQPPTGEEIDRLIVTMPPQHGKSELISHWLPAWYLGRHPDRKVLLGSYQAEQAQIWSVRARQTLGAFGPWIWETELDQRRLRADWWWTTGGGYMAADGLGGAFTGKGAHLLIIDDPIKGYEEAASATMRDKAWEWWTMTLISRLQQEHAVILVQTRWHEDDLAGRLIEEGEWTVLNLPAFAESDDDPLGRRIGDPLCPELHSKEKLERQRRTSGEYAWTALYQQRPAPLQGFLFKREYFRSWTEETVGADTFYVLHSPGGSKRYPQGGCARFQVVDVAASAKETADFTVVSTWAATPDRKLLLLDVRRRRFEEQQMLRFVASVNDEWDRCPIYVERVGANVGAPLSQFLRMQGRAVADVFPRGDKLVRAQSAIIAYERGDVFHPRSASWLPEFEFELLSFPNAKHDDQVDCLAHACRLLPGLGVVKVREPRRVTVMGGVLGEQF